jgi:DNA-binding transcriptional regulator YiaG
MGRPRDNKTRALVNQLRAKGMSFRDIGRRLGMTRQGACSISKTPVYRRSPVRCRDCDRELNARASLPKHDRAVYCLDCLAKHPEASFVERMRALRIGLGLNMDALAVRLKTTSSNLHSYEAGSKKLSLDSERRLLAAIKELTTLRDKLEEA